MIPGSQTANMTRCNICLLIFDRDVTHADSTRKKVSFDLGSRDVGTGRLWRRRGWGRHSSHLSSGPICRILEFRRPVRHPADQQTYPDRAGTALDEKNWLRSWTNELYLWFDEVTDQDPSGFATATTSHHAKRPCATRLSLDHSRVFVERGAGPTAALPIFPSSSKASTP